MLEDKVGNESGVITLVLFIGFGLAGVVAEVFRGMILTQIEIDPG